MRWTRLVVAAAASWLCLALGVTVAHARAPRPARRSYVARVHAGHDPATARTRRHHALALGRSHHARGPRAIELGPHVHGMLATAHALAPRRELAAPAATPADTDDPALGRAGDVNGHETTGVVAFTFDDGPNPATTPAVLDALERYDIPATFFIVTRRLGGKEGEQGRAVLARELADGFLIGDHTAHHKNLRAATPATLVTEVDRSVHELAQDASRPIGMFRPPYGAMSGAARAHLQRLGLTEVRWSVDTKDWRAHDAMGLRRRVLRDITRKDGGIVLMHDIKPITAQILAGVLDDLEAENCRRLAAGRPPIVPVSIHYFLRDGRLPRAIPEAVRQRTAAYEAALPGRCASRTAALAAPSAAPPALSRRATAAR